MKKKLFTLFCLVSLNITSAISQISWYHSISDGKEISQSRNKLILADFWANWCRPCKEMDAKVWSKNPIQKLAENFIPVKFDLSDGFHAASTYSVKGIPTIMILDSWGDILYQSTGYMSDSEVEKILQSFPADVERLNKALATFHEDKKNKNKLVIVALAFQEYGKESKGQGKITFLRKCDEYLNHAKKRSSKDEVVFREKVEILKALNKVYWGKENVAIKTLRDKIGIEKICKENQALANFVLTNAFIGIQDKNEAEKFFVKLKNSEGSEEFIKQIGCMFQ